MLPTRTLASRLAVTLTIIASSGCGSGPDAAADPFGGAPWTVEGPEVRIGSLDDPDYIFGSVVGTGRCATVRFWASHPAGRT